MAIKLIPRLKPFLGLKEFFALFSFSRGNIPEFEKQFSSKFACNNGVMFQHGRSGLYALFKAWDLTNAEIICPAYTCVVVPHSIVLSGNHPVFIDCEKNSPNMDYEMIEKEITERTKAIVVTHIFGYPMDVNKILKIVKNAEKKYGNKIYIIQDVAHSFGAKWEGEMVTKFGDAAVFGLNISKTITTIFGGMILTNSNNTYTKLISYRNRNFKKQGIIKTLSRIAYLIAIYCAFNIYMYRIVNWFERLKVLNKFVKYYDDDKIYFPADWDVFPSEIEARIGLIQLKRYDYIVEQRTKNALRWIEKLKDRNDISFFPHIEGSTYSHCVGLVKNRKTWIDKYYKKGIQLGILIEYSVPYMKAYAKYKKNEYPISKQYSESTINFPIWAN